MTRAKSPDRYSRILDAAAATFLELGYRRTRLGAVAKRADVSTGTIYLYARSKPALFELVLRRAFGDASHDPLGEPYAGSAGDDLVSWLWDRFNEIARFPVLERAARSPAGEDPRGELEAVLREVWAWQSTYWQAIEIIERCAHDWPELQLLFYRQFRRGVFGTATTLIQRRMDEGAFRRYPDAATVVRVIAENIAFFAMHRHIRPDSADLDEATCRETVIGMLLGSLAARAITPATHTQGTR